MDKGEKQMKKYYILYDYGFRKIWIKTTKEDYYRIIMSMKAEFTVHNKEKEYKGFSGKNKNKKLIINEQYIINYWGDEYTFACTEEIKRKLFI